MKILPVLDLLDGVVVRGVAGKRDEYRPVESCLAATADPLAVARGFREQLGLNELYVADLDAILSGRLNTSVFRALVADGFEIAVDAGLKNSERATEVLDTGAGSIIAGLETIPGPDLLRSLCNQFGSERVVFSLDLKGGRPLGDLAAWNTSDPLEIGIQAGELGARRIIVLDLEQVGVGQGVQTLELCRCLRDRFPQSQLITGGGVRHFEDLHVLQSAGIDAVLIASALHDGRIGAGDVKKFSAE